MVAAAAAWLWAAARACSRGEARLHISAFRRHHTVLRGALNCCCLSSSHGTSAELDAGAAAARANRVGGSSGEAITGGCFELPSEEGE